MNIMIRTVETIDNPIGRVIEYKISVVIPYNEMNEIPSPEQIERVIGDYLYEIR